MDYDLDDLLEKNSEKESETNVLQEEVLNEPEQDSNESVEQAHEVPAKNEMNGF